MGRIEINNHTERSSFPLSSSINVQTFKQLKAAMGKCFYLVSRDLNVCDN